jgi:hypothetical protein
MMLRNWGWAEHIMLMVGLMSCALGMCIAVGLSYIGLSDIHNPDIGYPLMVATAIGGIVGALLFPIKEYDMIKKVDE